MPLQGNGAIRLTTSSYYTPSGRSIQAVGVVPDVLVEQTRVNDDDDENSKSRTEANLKGSLENDSLSDNEKQRLEEEERMLKEKAKLRRDDYQLSYALDLLKGFSVLQQNN